MRRHLVRIGHHSVNIILICGMLHRFVDISEHILDHSAEICDYMEGTLVTLEDFFETWQHGLTSKSVLYLGQDVMLAGKHHRKH